MAREPHAAPAPARTAAWRALRAVETRRADLGTALADSRRQLADERDVALAATIVTGTLRWQAALDALIDRRSRLPPESIATDVRLVLRLSAFQLTRLSRVPASAIVNDAVMLVRQAGHPRAAGFVNAILRRFRGRETLDELPHPPAKGQDGSVDREAALDYLSITLSHPRWLAARWLDRVGFDAAARWTAFNNQDAPITLRANIARNSRAQLADRLADEAVETTPTAYSPDGLVVLTGRPLATSAWEEGLFVVQDEASQLVACAAAVQPTERVLDACAAPGGKATAMSAAASHGRVVALDLRPRRVTLLKEVVARLGAGNVAIVRADAEHLPVQAAFDCAVIDAPCSGLGTIRRDPDIRWRRGAEDLATFAGHQRRMLREAASAVVPGGRLVYATCSSEPEENEDVVADFLAASREFEQLRVDVPGASEAAPLVDEQGALRTRPDAHGLEAFYAVLMRRTPSG